MEQYKQLRRKKEKREKEGLPLEMAENKLFLYDSPRISKVTFKIALRDKAQRHSKAGSVVI